ncbi:MAG: hypothetical protein ACRDJ9_15310, partial [Dehalococcoidia bacterium]
LTALAAGLATDEGEPVADRGWVQAPGRAARLRQWARLPAGPWAALVAVAEALSGAAITDQAAALFVPEVEAGDPTWRADDVRGLSMRAPDSAPTDTEPPADTDRGREPPPD